MIATHNVNCHQPRCGATHSEMQLFHVSSYEDQFVKTPTIGRFQGFFSALHATRVGMTPWRRDWVRWKAEIQEMDFKKNQLKIFIFSWRNFILKISFRIFLKIWQNPIVFQ